MQKETVQAGAEKVPPAEIHLNYVADGGLYMLAANELPGFLVAGRDPGELYARLEGQISYFVAVKYKLETEPRYHLCLTEEEFLKMISGSQFDRQTILAVFERTKEGDRQAA